MGDIADMMLDGTLCEGCGVYLGADGDYPQRCPDCERALKRELQTRPYSVPAAKIACPHCDKKLAAFGSSLPDHIRDKHGRAALGKESQ